MDFGVRSNHHIGLYSGHAGMLVNVCYNH